MLKMKTECERCQGELHPMGRAFICSYECTYCADCAGDMNRICPNCEGELVVRPSRERAPASVATSLIGRKLRGMLGREQLDAAE